MNRKASVLLGAAGLGVVIAVLIVSMRGWGLSADARSAYEGLMRARPKAMDLRQIRDSGALPGTRDGLEKLIIPNNEALLASRGVRLASLQLGGVPVVEITPARDEHPRRALIYVHGGAFVFLSALSSLASSVPLASDLGVKVLAVDYVPAPEHRIPEMRRQIVAVVRALIGRGYRAADIGFLADSAGATLAVGAIHELLSDSEETSTRFWALVLYSPWVDLRLRDDSLRRNAARDPLLRVEDYLEVAAQLAIEPGATPDDPWNSVTLLPLSKRFPPTLIQVGEREILQDQASTFYQTLRRRGVFTRLQVFPGLWHVFQATHPDLPESRHARARAREFLMSNVAR